MYVFLGMKPLVFATAGRRTVVRWVTVRGVMVFWCAAHLLAMNRIDERLAQSWYGMPRVMRDEVMVVAAINPGQDTLGECTRKIHRDKKLLPPAIRSIAFLIDGTMPDDVDNPRNDLWQKIENQRRRLRDEPLDPLAHSTTVHLKSDIDQLGLALDAAHPRTNATVLDKITTARTTAGNASGIVIDPLQTQLTLSQQNIASGLSIADGLDKAQGNPQRGRPGGLIGTDGNKRDGLDSKKNLVGKLSYLLWQLNDKTESGKHTTLNAAIGDVCKGGGETADKDLVDARPVSKTLSEAIIAVAGDTPKGQNGGIIGSDNNTISGLNKHKDIYGKLLLFRDLIDTRQTEGGALESPDLVATLFALQGDVLTGNPGGIIGTDGNTDSGFDSKQTLYAKMQMILECLNLKSGSSYPTIYESIDNLSGDLTAYKNLVDARPETATLDAAIIEVAGDTTNNAPGGIIGSDGNSGPGGLDEPHDIYAKCVVLKGFLKQDATSLYGAIVSLGDVIGSDGNTEDGFDSATTLHEKLEKIRDALVALAPETDTIAEALCAIGGIGCPAATS